MWGMLSPRDIASSWQAAAPVTHWLDQAGPLDWGRLRLLSDGARVVLARYGVMPDFREN
jgi:hypothetical protein